MHLGRASFVIAGALALALAACGDGGGAIEDNVVRPGVTALEGAPTAACGQDIAALTAALDSYATLEGAPAPDESALVATGYLRDESDLLDVIDGQIVAQDVACDDVVPKITPTSTPMTAPATTIGDIVTSTEQMTTDDVLATMTEADVSAYGGVECATEIAAISAAGQVFIIREGRNPNSLVELSDDLDREITLWTFDGDAQALAPADGSSCPDAFRESADAQQASICDSERATLEVAVEAYLAQEGSPPPDEQTLVDAGLIRTLIDAYDLDDTGTVVPAPDSPCS
jgi:hypothetical protein